MGKWRDGEWRMEVGGCMDVPTAITNSGSQYSLMPIEFTAATRK